MCIKAKYSYLKNDNNRNRAHISTRCLWKKKLAEICEKYRNNKKREQKYKNGNIYRKQNKHMTIQVKTLLIVFLFLFVYLLIILNSNQIDS
jgi:hypothetical protein